MTAEVAREFDEGDVFLANVVENADCARPLTDETNDAASGAAELALQGIGAQRGEMKEPLEQLGKDIHESNRTKISPASNRAELRAGMPGKELHRSFRALRRQTT